MTSKLPEKPEFIEVGNENAQRRIAILRQDGDNPGLFWLGGFKSDMEGSKAIAIAEFGAHEGLQVTRFDYSGHSKSSGSFSDGTIGLWLEEALAVFERTSGQQIIVGSSMGGWLALLLNNILQRREDSRVKAIILIAPAVDMSDELMEKKFNEEQLSALKKDGYIEQPSEYDEPYIITKKLIEEGKNHLLFGKPIVANCPVYILQGALDKAVPVAHSLKLLSHMMLDPVFFTLVPDGDHSLSRKKDLDLLRATITRIICDAQ